MKIPSCIMMIFDPYTFWKWKSADSLDSIFKVIKLKCTNRLFCIKMKIIVKKWKYCKLHTYFVHITDCLPKATSKDDCSPLIAPVHRVRMMFMKAVVGNTIWLAPSIHFNSTHSLHLNWSELAVSYLCSWSGLKLLYFRRNFSLFFFPMSNSTDLIYAGIKFSVWRRGSTWFVWMPILNLHYCRIINQRTVWSSVFFHLWLWFGIFLLFPSFAWALISPLGFYWRFHLRDWIWNPALDYH